jgi:opacity protein-like surface antigen
MKEPAVEAEALYIGTDRNTSFSTFGAGATETFSTNSGDFFLNGILRFKNDSIVTPYIGAGPGLQYLTTHGQFAGGRGVSLITGVNTSDLDFAAQALAGFNVQICQHVSLFSEYKFIDAIGTDGKSANFAGSGGTYRFKPDQIQQDLITAGVKYSF